MDWISGWWMEQIVSKIWCDETICSCIVCTGAILHTRANIQLWSAQSFWPNLLLLHGSAFMCRSCRQQRESQRGSIRLGSSKAPLPLLHSHLFPITGKKKTVHTSERKAALTKWHIAPCSTLPSPSLDASSSPSHPQNGWHLLALVEPDTLPLQWPWDKDEGVIVRQ